MCHYGTEPEQWEEVVSRLIEEEPEEEFEKETEQKDEPAEERETPVPADD